jgi:hypothetical protein
LLNFCFKSSLPLVEGRVYPTDRRGKGKQARYRGDRKAAARTQVASSKSGWLLGTKPTDWMIWNEAIASGAAPAHMFDRDAHRIVGGGVPQAAFSE